MSIGELAYLSGIIAAFLTFMVVLSTVERIERRKQRAATAAEAVAPASRHDQSYRHAA